MRVKPRLYIGFAATAGFFALALVPLAAASRTETAPFHLTIPWMGPDASCPSGYSPTTECHLRSGGPVAIPGFGFVTQSYVFALEFEPGPSCPFGLLRPLSYPARLTVQGRGEIYVAVSASDVCADGAVPLIHVAQTFTITGGTEVFAGASGTGVVSRTNVRCFPGSGTDNWNGTITSPALTLDLTPPTITGPSDKVVRAPRYRLVHVSRRQTKRVRVTYVRVRYDVTAVDAVDGEGKVDCKPTSGSRFRVGRTTTVNCSATDKSANTATAQFTVTVRRG